MSMTASAFGFSGFDPIGTYASNRMDFAYNRKLMKYQARLEYDYKTRAAREMPSFIRQGLVNAGYNPILAINGGAGGDYGMPSASPSGTSSNGNSGFSASDFYAAKNARALARAELETAEAERDMMQSESAKAQAEAEMAQSESAIETTKRRLEMEAFSGFDAWQGESKTAKDYRQSIKNAVERERYENSREHSMMEDATKLWDVLYGSFGGNSTKQMRRQSRRFKSRRP